MLENVDRVMGRMRQLERRLEGPGVPVDSNGFHHLMNGRLQELSGEPAPKPADPAAQRLNELSLLSAMRQPAGLDPSILGASAAAGIRDVLPLAQNNNISCGQTSVAMCINALTGKNLQDYDINQSYGFELLNALNGETREAGFSWRDGGEVCSSSWDLIDHKVNVEKLPVIVGLNGPEFSPSGKGHIVTIVKTEGDVVHYADPATGTVKTTTKQAMNQAPQHPDGNFIFYSVNEQRLDGGLFPQA